MMGMANQETIFIGGPWHGRMHDPGQRPTLSVPYDTGESGKHE